MYRTVSNLVDRVKAEQKLLFFKERIEYFGLNSPKYSRRMVSYLETFDGEAFPVPLVVIDRCASAARSLSNSTFLAVDLDSKEIYNKNHVVSYNVDASPLSVEGGKLYVVLPKAFWGVFGISLETPIKLDIRNVQFKIDL